MTPHRPSTDHPPRRIQLQRRKGWRIRQAVKVARPTVWGNPYRWQDYRADYPEDTDAELRAKAVSDFRGMVERRWPGPEGTTYPHVVTIRHVLGGHDLACWCPIGEPCHADVLLELANPDPTTKENP